LRAFTYQNVDTMAGQWYSSSVTKRFNIPAFYRSAAVSKVKAAGVLRAPEEQDLSPSVLDLGRIKFKIARHFGLCFGVGNAIEIAYRALAENPQRRVFLLSEMIHNSHVNSDLESRGVRFILGPKGEQLVPFSDLHADDIVIVPAFGTTVELLDVLKGIGIDPCIYDATCPFVQRVWKKASSLSSARFSVIVHGKPDHEETRATFSHARRFGPTIVIRNLEEAERLALYIRGVLPPEDFGADFGAQASSGFDPTADLARVGVVNQTTMLATQTQAICSTLRLAFEQRYGKERLEERFADTSDTLCYATSENQMAATALMDAGGDLSIVVGGYNSSNTSHLVEISQRRLATYYIKDAGEILDLESIRHLNLSSRQTTVTRGWFPKDKDSVEVLLTAGASCPDILVEEVLYKIADMAGARAALERQFQSPL
jgi:4-hydroxy-3-methylbut-2-en-1-yl diphosphate reductase